MNALRALLLIALAAAPSSTGRDQSAGSRHGTFIPTGDMIMPRSQHSATLLNDGTVLIAGGYSAPGPIVASAELYDPATGTFERVGDMSVARRDHTATLLPDGRVLIAGGFSENSALAQADIYDPATRSFSPVAPLLDAQGCHAATLLRNGKVLIAGGGMQATTAPAELFDPATGQFTLAAVYADAANVYGGPLCPTATLLPDGRVLLLSENPAETYDPDSNTFSLTGRMAEPEYGGGVEMHSATLLHDGTVLLTGGNDDNTPGGLNDAELYEPASGTFRAVARMSTAHDFHTSTTLEDGSVLIAGGGDGWAHTPGHDNAELYDPEKQSFADAGTMTRQRSQHTATLLRDGTVLIAGGGSVFSTAEGRYVGSAELYRPALAPPRRRAAHH